MGSAWIESGPVSIPSRPLAVGAGVTVAILAIVGFALGFQTSIQRTGASGLGVTAGRTSSHDDELIAKPIVELAPPAPAPVAEKSGSDDGDDDKADAIAAQTAAAQAIQAKPSNGAGNIDDVLASPTEKPPAAPKVITDGTPPGTPVKSDVPF